MKSGQKEGFTALGNPWRLTRLLQKVVDKDAIAAIQSEHKRTVKTMLELSMSHRMAAKKLSRIKHWRSFISRLYYCAYIANRAVRYGANGQFEASAQDHENSKNLPEDFQEKDRWRDFFRHFHLDRNMCDYDSEAGIKDLHYPPAIYAQKTDEFIAVAEKFLQERSML